ncbi:hypothetical protein GEMRC1_006625 [Eukaryota sp. GEM-RC1]
MDSKISQFLEICPDASPSDAQRLLEVSNGDIDQAILLFFESGPQPTASTAPSVPQPRPTPSSVPTQSRPPVTSHQTSSTRRVATLSDFGSCSPQDCSSCPSECSSKQGQDAEWHVGHGEGGSSEALIPPRQRHAHQEQLEKLIQSAQQAPPPSEPVPSPPQHFPGAGYRLGDTDLLTKKNLSNNLLLLMKVRNGLLVFDDQFFDFADPSNSSMLEAMLRQEMPPQVEKLVRERVATRGGPMRSRQIDVQLSDKRGEDYSPPKPEFVPFVGQGARLGAHGGVRPQPVVEHKQKEEKPTFSEGEVSVKVRLAGVSLMWLS